jgi:hypothetical protein
LIVSHEHFDHFWGIGSTLRHCPAIPIYLPEGFHPAGLAFIREQGHTGSVITVASEQPLVLFPGLAVVSFPMSTLLQVQGENVLYANLEDQGLTMITGCGHGGVLNLLDYARRSFTGGERIHAIYGGCTFLPWKTGTTGPGRDRQGPGWLWDRQDGVQSLHRPYGCREDAGERLARPARNGPARLPDGIVPGQRRRAGSGTGTCIEPLSLPSTGRSLRDSWHA